MGGSNKRRQTADGGDGNRTPETPSAAIEKGSSDGLSAGEISAEALFRRRRIQGLEQLLGPEPEEGGASSPEDGEPADEFEKRQHEALSLLVFAARPSKSDLESMQRDVLQPQLALVGAPGSSGAVVGVSAAGDGDESRLTRAWIFEICEVQWNNGAKTSMDEVELADAVAPVELHKETQRGRGYVCGRTLYQKATREETWGLQFS